MRRLFSSVVFACMIFAVSASFAEEPFRIYSAKKVAKAPVIDGKLTEECWTKAEKTSSFVAIYGAKVSTQTTGLLCWDNKNLYVGYICEEPLAATMRDLIQKGAITGFEESIELFVDGNFDRNTYVQFMVGASGQRHNSKGMMVDPAMNDLWSSEVSLNDNNWSVEIRVPLDILGIRRPSEKSLCGLNLNRTRTIGGSTVYSCWSDTKGGFHTPSRFGRLIFVSYADWLRADIQERLAGENREMKRLMKKYRKSTSAFKGKFDDLKKAHHKFLEMLSSESPDTAEKFAPLNEKADALVARYAGLLAEMRLAVIRDQFQK